jgi:hypothetical protein
MERNTHRMSHLPRLFLLAVWLAVASAMTVHDPRSFQTACERVTYPVWPLAYDHGGGSLLEMKGRVASNELRLGDTCTTRGMHAKCFRCESFACNSTEPCSVQIQGLSYDSLPTNAQTVTDVPWSVGGSHRYDYAGGTHVCLYLMNDTVRCWGHSFNPPSLDATTRPEVRVGWVGGGV